MIKKKIFIDCGTNLGQGLKTICKLEDIDNTWDVYSFEANPKTFEKIEKNKYVRYFNVAVSDKYEFSIFNCEKMDNENGFVGGGSTLLELNNWNSEKVYNFKPDYIQTIVPVIDLIDFILKIDPEENSIILKIDIEGSEYKILKKIEYLKFFKYIKKIYIEFHDHVVNDLDIEHNSNYWINYFINNNIEYKIWH